MIYIKRNIIKSILIISILLVSTISVALASEYSHAPKMKAKNGTSTNWAGYAVDTNDSSVTSVKGSWVVPTVDPLATKKDQYCCFWIGIDGDISSTVEQIGTDCEIIKGVPTYTAWYEFYPQNAITIDSMKIKPGDKITAEVKYDPNKNKFTVYIADTDSYGNVQSFSASPAKPISAKRNSAEWITESLTGTQFAKFNQVDFSSNSATIDGIEYNLGSLSTIDRIYMVTNSGLPKATPTVLAQDGNFSIIWNSAGR